MERLLVTGASGYIGSRLVKKARARGVEVVAADLRPGSGGRRYDLADPDFDARILDGVDAVVHLAAIIHEDSQPPGAAEDLNVSGSRRLLEAARDRGVRRFVFVSTHAASEEAPTRYIRSKWNIERMLTGEGEIVARLGLVSGGAPLGVYGGLLRMCRTRSVLPALCPGAPVYPIHVDDICEALLGIACSESPPGPIVWLGRDEPVRFADYLRTVARERLGRRLRLLPVPTWPVLALCAVAERLPFAPRLPAERIRGLAALRPVDTSRWPGPREAGVEPRDYRDALRHEGSRRRLIAEGRTLMAYVLGAAPPAGAVRRYVRAVMAEADRGPLDLSGAVTSLPALLRWVEPIGSSGGRLRRRLALATEIVEMTPAGAARFHAYEARSRPVALAALVWLVATEGVFMLVRGLLGRIVSGKR